MKRVVSLQKSVVVASVLAGLLLTATSFSYGPSGDARLVSDPPQKKEQRVKVIVSKDGKTTKIDTTFNLPDMKTIQFKVDSMLEKMGIAGVEAGKLEGLVQHAEKRIKWMEKEDKNFPGRKEFDLFIQHADTGEMSHKRKIIHLGDGGSLYSFGGPDGDVLIPPPPPMPPHNPVIIRKRMVSDPFAFDSKDPSIISYDKKDFGKGLEKITIIRKKQVEQHQEKKVEVSVETSDKPKK